MEKLEKNMIVPISVMIFWLKIWIHANSISIKLRVLEMQSQLEAISVYHFPFDYILYKNINLILYISKDEIEIL